MSANIKIIHKDSCIIVIDKPAGVPCVSIRKNEKGTLAAQVIELFPEQKVVNRGELEAGFVHRLDNDTSGVIVAARTNEAHEFLRREFDAGDVTKEYTALVVGILPNEGIIETPIAHHPRKKKKMMVCASESEAKKHKARAAVTRFKVIKKYNFQGTRYSLLSVEIKTGVRHQIRAHLASIGHPIAGDTTYQNPKLKEMDILRLKRHFLHASRIEFVHPSSEKRVEFSSELPSDLKETLSRIARRD